MTKLSNFAISLILVLGTILADVQASDLFRWVPDNVNALAWVNVEQVYQSELAKRENWARKSRDAFFNRESVIPPGTKEQLLCSEIDLADGLVPIREFAIASAMPGIELESLASLLGASMERLGDQPAFTTERGTTVVAPAKELWLATSQGGRQAARRWMQQGPASSPNLSDHLAMAWKQRDSKAQVFVALDLADAADPISVSQFVEEFAPKASKMQQAGLVQLLQTVRSAALDVTVDDAIHGRCVLTFADTVAPLVPYLSEFVPSALQSIGASDSGALESWKWSASGQTLVGKGELTAANVRRIVSLIHGGPPTANLSASPGDTVRTSPADSPSEAVIASRKYLRSVRTVLDDLQDTLKNTRDNHALWYERSARKIDEFPMRSVDAELLDFGARVSNSLRYQGQVQRVTKVRSGTTKANVKAGTAYRTYTGNPYGWTSQLETGAEPGTIDKNYAAQASEVKFSEWKQIEDGFVQIRRRLTEKLMADF